MTTTRLSPALLLSLLPFTAICATAAEKALPAATQTATTISVSELQSAMDSKKGWLIVDVREPDEFAQGHLAGAVNIPLGQVETRKGEIPKDKTVVLMCRSGRRSGLAQETLAKAGFTNLRNLEGGILAWKGPVTK